MKATPAPRKPKPHSFAMEHGTFKHGTLERGRLEQWINILLLRAEHGRQDAGGYAYELAKVMRSNPTQTHMLKGKMLVKVAEWIKRLDRVDDDHRIVNQTISAYRDLLRKHNRPPKIEELMIELEKRFVRGTQEEGEKKLREDLRLRRSMLRQTLRNRHLPWTRAKAGRRKREQELEMRLTSPVRFQTH